MLASASVSLLRVSNSSGHGGKCRWNMLNWKPLAKARLGLRCLKLWEEKRSEYHGLNHKSENLVYKDRQRIHPSGKLMKYCTFG